jgi:GNAT superfamily N-acetyltransferase
MSDFAILPLTDADRPWVARLLTEAWSASRIVSRGRVHQSDQLPGFVAWRGAERLGLLTYRVERDEVEVVSLNSLVERIGVGTALLRAAEQVGRGLRCRRLWLITTNDNLPALRFYQRRNWTLAALYPNALEQSRRLKPEIPLVGLDDIPLRDEIELELRV